MATRKMTATKMPEAAKPKANVERVTKKSAEAASIAKRKRAAKARPAKAKPAAKPARAKALRERLSLETAMRELEKAGTEQARKTYARHGVDGPMFGVSFATLKAMKKRIGVDHELALALWNTGNFDARNLAVELADPARLTPADLDRWGREGSRPPHGTSRFAKRNGLFRHGRARGAWVLLGQLAQRDESLPDGFFAERLAHIEKTIHRAPDAERHQMNGAIITIGCRNAALRKAALAAAKRIGKVDVDQGDTACETPDAAEYIEKTWAHAKAKRFESPAAQESARDTPRAGPWIRPRVRAGAPPRPLRGRQPSLRDQDEERPMIRTSIAVALLVLPPALGQEGARSLHGAACRSIGYIRSAHDLEDRLEKAGDR